MSEKMNECTYRLKVIKEQNVEVETKIFREGEIWAGLVLGSFLEVGQR